MDAAPPVPRSLIERIRADPVHAPEIIALAAADKHGPAARDWAAGQRGSEDKLARKAKRMHARYARASGAITGVGGVLTMLPDMIAAIWIQSRVVFFVAAAYGYDPMDRMRPAELLVLYELYEDPGAAREALDGTGPTLAEAAARRALTGREDETLIARLTSMVVKRGASRLAGRSVPGFAIFVNAVGNEQAVRTLAHRAIAFYGGGD
jgi:hypothetical protein